MVSVAVRRLDRPDQRVGHRQVRLEVAAQREERQVHRAGRVAADHPEVAVLLDLERLGRDLALDPPPDGAEPADTRIAEPREDELAGDAGGDHLVVDQVGRQPRQRQVALALADDLVTGGEADEVGEALDRDRVAVTDEVRDGVAHRGDLGAAHGTIMTSDRGERWAVAQPADSTPCSAPASATSARTAGPWSATAATASPKIRSAVSISASETVSAGDIRTLRLAALEDEQAALEAGPLDLLGVLGGVELDAEHQALAADVADEAVEAPDERTEPGLRLLATGRGVGDEAALEQLDRGERRGAGDRVAAVGRAVRARSPCLEEIGAGDHRAQGHPGRDPLGRQQDVRLDAPVLDRPHLAGPPGARLDLVGDQQDAVLVTDVAEALEEPVLGDDVAALALDRLDDDRRDLVGRRELVEQDVVEPLEVLDPAVRGVEDPRQQRPEAGVVLGLRGRQRDRAVGPTVERAEERDDVRPLGREPRELDRRLDDLGPGVAEIGAHAARDRRDPRQLAADLGVDRQVEVRRREMDQLGRLLLDRGHDLRMRVTGRVDRDAGGEIEEEVAVDVLDDEAVAADRDDRVGTREAGRGPRLVELDVGPCLRPGKLGDDVRDRPIPGDPRRARRQGAPLRSMHNEYAGWISPRSIAEARGRQPRSAGRAVEWVSGIVRSGDCASPIRWSRWA